MLNSIGYSALGQIYDAATNPGRWRRALDGVSQTVDAKAAALLIRNPDRGAKDLQMLNSVYLDFTRSPWGMYYGLRLARLQNPDWDILSRQSAHEPTFDTAAGISADDLDRRADYAFLRKRIGVGRRIGFRLNNDRAWFDGISFALDSGSDRVSPAAITQAQLLLPHLTKAVEINRTFAKLRARYSAVLAALDHVRVGLAVALPDGEIVVRNAEAERIFDLADGLGISGGKLRCADADQTSAISAAIFATGQTARGEDQTSQSFVAVDRPSTAPPFLVDIAPLKDTMSELGGPLEGALVTVVDQNRLPELPLDRFGVLYGLTPAEIEVCGLIMHGYSTVEIAEQRGTSPDTAKTQVASVLGKTGTRRRAEIIRLVIRAFPPVV